jgi:hypothetical protein
MAGIDNYLELNIKFKSLSIKWFVLEFESKNEDFDEAFAAGVSLFRNIQSGSRIPCTFDSSAFSSLKP